ncbi:MAG: hypothetical protein JJLCMIEE_01958 [Acidimicrobiales bacterium]|nr:MAG: class I SAM-dependent methyltransferase [Actinomycetota bacterium]MBV6508891.1 hypothetical protein [Acidimicrobiales bacterium]RIK03946.1 MAG: class I SAM-dependent methyltransferase [Acidobacteriota bacterium]
MQTSSPDPEYDPAAYGRNFADVYDRWYGDVSDIDATVEFVAGLAEEGPGLGLVLELGIGTGRLALPLSERGLSVAGIDASTEMVELLRAKRGGAAIPVQIADMADPVIRRGPPARVVLAAYNTLVNLPSEAAQQRCLLNVAARLEPGGSFVSEMFVPAARMPSQRRTTPTRLGGDQIVLAATEVEPAGQTVVGEHIELIDGGVRVRPWRLRYLYPDQLDALAAAAGLELVGRWGGWRRQPFTDKSADNVSLYRLP